MHLVQMKKNPEGDGKGSRFRGFFCGRILVVGSLAETLLKKRAQVGIDQQMSFWKENGLERGCEPLRKPLSRDG